MAAASTLQYGRQKKNVYGKASKSSWSTNFFDESDDELTSKSPAPTIKPVAQRNTSVKASYPVQKTEVRKAPSPKVAKTKAAKQDTFDVPSSYDEPSPPPKTAQKPVFRPKQLLVDDQTEAETNLTPWEREEVRMTTNKSTRIAKRSKFSAATPDDQLRSDLVGAAKSHVEKQLSSATQHSVPAAGNDYSSLSSAAARLAARKRVAEPSAHPANGAKGTAKRAPAKAASEGTPRKRAKTTDTSRGSSVDVIMTDVATLPFCEGDGGELAGGDVYDFPDSSAEESSNSRQHFNSSRITKKPARRAKPTTSSPRATPRKGLSAPARLAEMLPVDSDMTETSTASPPGAASRSGTPQRPSTPPSMTRRSPDTAIKSRGNITPKQAQLWNRLLPSQPMAPSPSALATKELSISGQKPRSSEREPAAKRLTKSQPDVGRRRTRLVDRLKASAQSSSEDETDSSSSELGDACYLEAGDVVKAEPPSLERAESTQSRVETASGSQSQSQSQTRSQSTATSTIGPKRTYASQRSYLAEDNLEDDIMAGLLEDTPKQPAARPKVFGRSQAKLNKDSFDMEDSDDDGAGTGPIRSIHELRAAGRNIRGTEDIEQMLEDIENRNKQHKSRRRSALIELATKLADKNFASRFIGQGCDVRLAKQCGASQDDIDHCLLAAAVVLLLASDPPEHTLRTLQDNDVTFWLGGLLSETREIGKMAKDRQYNIAKASQTSLVQLGELLRTQQSLWAEESLAVMSPRSIALKGLDLLIGKSRRAGDKSELLSLGHQQLTLPDNETLGDAGIETSLAISILESLSTASLALVWTQKTLHRIAQTLTSLDQSSSRGRHTFFLTLRLCSNITTDNALNCDTLAAEPQTVHHLLQTVLDGFGTLDAETEEENRALALDLLVLALGILMNFFEHSATARSHTTHAPSNSSEQLTSLVNTFTAGQRRMEDAESVAESTANVALGYLAVMLANLCQDAGARTIVRDALPGRRLAVLGDAVEEFVLFHQQVDGMAGFTFEGEEGKAVWGVFTERLRGCMERVRGLENEGQGDGEKMVE